MQIPDTDSGTQTRHALHGHYPRAETADDFRHNLALVQERIAAACQRVGRDPATVRLLPVSKTIDGYTGSNTAPSAASSPSPST